MTPEQKQNIMTRVDKHLNDLPWFINEYIDYRIDASANTLYNYVRDYYKFFDWIVNEGIHPGPMTEIDIYTLEKLTMQNIISFERYCMRNNNRVDTIARRLNSLRSLFHYLSQVAEDEEGYPYLHRNVMVKVNIRKEKLSNKKKAEKIANKILLDDEISAFRNFIREDYGNYLLEKNQKRKHSSYLYNRERDLALISFMLGSGLRISEALSVNVDTIDWNNNQVDITRKGDSGDVVSFSNVAAEDMKRYLEIRDDRYKVSRSNKAFFLSRKTGNGGLANRLTVRAAQLMINHYADAFGKSSLTLHKLRHSFATNYYKVNKDLATLKTILNHANLETTMIYTYISNKQIEQSINKADSR
ncbi:tyrosine recombinase XerS [Virgibacillus salexigens]|uniref:Tyrosine recombinase XerS n=1 Tax=Virgibacillus massiliensis TaxID=1462526 RepID=A0A024QID4_9BACI|nr:tyrosine recombinase XerS [Virgibacillus massiliensis]CDQ41945.1 Tyrosine recombinase XerS [Virgibacillus massiliensis]